MVTKNISSEMDEVIRKLQYEYWNNHKKTIKYIEATRRIAKELKKNGIKMFD